MNKIVSTADAGAFLIDTGPKLDLSRMSRNEIGKNTDSPEHEHGPARA